MKVLPKSLLNKPVIGLTVKSPSIVNSFLITKVSKILPLTLLLTMALPSMNSTRKVKPPKNVKKTIITSKKYT
ncbi:hypothetical protein DQM16_11380 [Levilactobacillus brevis]|nr:hypothetical protein DQM16_11380 [Levilactobacillus brevis]